MLNTNDTDISQINKNNFELDNLVKIKDSATSYVSEHLIPSWVKNNRYTVGKLTDNTVFLKEINSWVYSKDIYLANKLTPISEFKIGDAIKIKNSATEFLSGKTISEKEKNTLYKILEIENNKVLLDKLSDWIYIADILIYSENKI